MPEGLYAGWPALNSPAAPGDVPKIALAGLIHASELVLADEGLVKCKGHVCIAIKHIVCYPIANQVTLQCGKHVFARTSFMKGPFLLKAAGGSV